MVKIKEYLKPNWESNRERIILFADILGFKRMLLDNKHIDFLKKFRAFIDRLKSLMLPLQAGNHLRISIFSDTIIIGADSCTLKNFNLIVKASAILMYVCHEFKWPINGCIACGNLTFDIPIQSQEEVEEYKHKRIVPFNVPILLGDAVIYSYSINMEMFCYGIVLHENMIPLLEAANKSIDDKLHQPFYKSLIPLKDGTQQTLHYLYWIKVPTHVNNGKITFQNIEDWLKELEINQCKRVMEYINNTRNILININSTPIRYNSI